MKNKSKIIIKTYNILCWAIFGSALVYMIVRGSNIIMNSKLVYYENKDISINGAIGKTSFNYLYRSLNIRDKGASYNDSPNAYRPLLIKIFPWAKVLSIHRYMYINHKKIKNCKYLYFYIYNKDIYGINGDNPPSKVYLFLEILNDIAAMFAASYLLIAWLLQWLIKKLFSSEVEMPEKLQVIPVLIMLLITVI